MATRRRVNEGERLALSERLRAIIASSAITQSEIESQTGVEQSVVSRFLSGDYRFETPAVATLIGYVNMRERGLDPEQLELPFETRVAMQRFLKQHGDLALLNTIIDVLTARAG